MKDLLFYITWGLATVLAICIVISISLIFLGVTDYLATDILNIDVGDLRAGLVIAWIWLLTAKISRS